MRLFFPQHCWCSLLYIYVSVVPPFSTTTSSLNILDISLSYILSYNLSVLYCSSLTINPSESFLGKKNKTFQRKNLKRPTTKMNFNCSSMTPVQRYNACQALTWSPVVIFALMIIGYHLGTGIFSQVWRSRSPGQWVKGIIFLHRHGYLEKKGQLRLWRMLSVLILFPHSFHVVLTVKLAYKMWGVVVDKSGARNVLGDIILRYVYTERASPFLFQYR